MDSLIDAINSKYRMATGNELSLIVKMKLENYLRTKRTHTIAICSDEEEFKEYLYNGYIMESDGTIRRYNCNIVFGADSLKIGYKQNGKIIYNATVAKVEKDLVLHQIVKSQGMKDNLKFISISNRIILYKGGV